MGRVRPGAVAATGRRRRRRRPAARPPRANMAAPSTATARRRRRRRRPSRATPRPPRERVGPVPTADETPAASDHDAVVGHVGIEARRFDPGPLPLTLRARLRLPGGRRGHRRLRGHDGRARGALLVDAQPRLERGRRVRRPAAGATGPTSRDTYFGFGPIVGLSLLLGNWRHLAVSASPELAYVWFRPGGTGGGAGTTTMLALRGGAGGGGALRLRRRAGAVDRLLAGMALPVRERGATRALWSVGVLGGDSVWGALSNLFVRYYL